MFRFNSPINDMPPPPNAMNDIPNDFWSDMSWCSVPDHRQTSFLEPICLRGGLLGGSSQAAPKMSKLQALAAARKKKAQEAKTGSTESGSGSAEAVTKPMARMTLGDASNAAEPISAPSPSAPAVSSSGKENTRSYSSLKRKDSTPHSKVSRSPTRSGPSPSSPGPMGAEISFSLPAVEPAAPSAFALTMFGPDLTSSRRPEPTAAQSPAFALNSILYRRVLPADAFAGPSPDDVVIAAQSQSKGTSTSTSATSGVPVRR
jgi:elongation factor 1 alpha-like protein